jgi:hypothetical protein
MTDSPSHHWICPQCGQMHDDLPFSYAADAPLYWYAVPPAERDSRAVLWRERCEIDGEHFFIRGNIRLAVTDAPEDFEWTVWVSLSPANYQRMTEVWHTPGRETEPPYFGWLSTDLRIYPSTLNLKTRVHTQPLGSRPLIELEPTDHPLAIEQRQGITLARVQEIAALLLHQEYDEAV